MPAERAEAPRPRLPHELVVIILQYVYIDPKSRYLTHLGNGESEKQPVHSPRERLKKVRLEGRAFCDAVTPALFASIHLHASDLSLARAEKVANSELAYHVRELVYHDGSFANQNTDQQIFLNTLVSHRRRQDYPWKGASRALDTRLYYNFLAEIQAAHRFPFREGLSFQNYPFQDLFQKLPNLITFVSLPYHDEWHDPETSAYTLRRTGLSYLPMPRNPTGSHWFIVAMTRFRPKYLDLSLFPSDVANTYIRGMGYHNEQAELKERLSRLASLKIGPAYGAKYGYGNDTDIGPGWHVRIKKFLGTCHNLTHLELTNDYPLSRRFAALPNRGLPRLTHLKFSAGTTLGIWPDKGLVECVRNVGDTLKHVEFSGITIKQHARTLLGDHSDDLPDLMGAKTASLVNVCCELTGCTTLESCRGLETVIDLKCEDGSKLIMSGPKPGKATLLEKMEDAVCHRAQWPLNLLQFIRSDGWDYSNPGSDIEKRRISFINACWKDTVDEFQLSLQRMTI